MEGQIPANQIPANDVGLSAAFAGGRVPDTRTAPKFDNLIEIVGACFNVPIALLSLADAEHRSFETAIGLNSADEALYRTFCTHLVDQTDAVAVAEDVTLDPRLSADPLVQGEYGIRFCANAPIPGADGSAIGTLCIIDRQKRAMTARDRTMLSRFAANAGSLLELDRHNRELRDAVKLDPLTGLMNRRGLEISTEKAMAGASYGDSCGVLYIDVDHFKQINDIHGHDVGDQVLNKVAHCLRSSVRGGDTIARIGGDEFVVLLAHPVSEQTIRRVASRILDNPGLTISADGMTAPVGLSIGAALAPRDGIDPAQLLRNADQALYDAKRAGRGRLMMAGQNWSGPSSTDCTGKDGNVSVWSAKVCEDQTSIQSVLKSWLQYARFGNTQTPGSVRRA